MNGEPGEIDRSAGRLRDILLGYLEAGGCLATWGGADGLTIEDILDAYPEAVARGEVPDWQQLLCRHPEVDAQLHVWMAAKDRWKFAVRRDPGVRPRGADRGAGEAQKGGGTS